MKKDFNSPWRITASTIYKKPSDSKILGSADLDVTELEAYINKKRKEGLKITLTHFFTLATGRAIEDGIPEFNTYLRRGKVVSFEELVAGVSLKMPSGDMSSIKVPNPGKKTYSEIYRGLNTGIEDAIKGTESKTNKMKNMLAYIPWPFRPWIFSLLRFITVTLSLPLPGINSQSFGTYIISNVGTLGLDGGYPALMPTGNISLVVIMGRVRDMPWVHKGQVVPRRIMKISAALDHRVVDASHGGKLFNFYRKAIRNPEMFE